MWPPSSCAPRRPFGATGERDAPNDTISSSGVVGWLPGLVTATVHTPVRSSPIAAGGVISIPTG
jgi:hypothetical protein